MSASKAFLPTGATITWTLLCASVFAVMSWKVTNSIKNARQLPLPPGPKPLPLIGNLLDLPTEQEWIGYDEICKKYGPIVYLDALGLPMIVVNNWEMANDLLEKRSRHFSDRVELRMLNGLMRWDWNFVLQCYGPRWRSHRRVFHQYFNSNAVVNYRQRSPFVPSPPPRGTRDVFSSLIMKVVYNIQVEEKNDRYITVALEAMRSLAIAATPGMFLVEFMPWLKYVPEWFPGAGFKRQARYWSGVSDEFQHRPFDKVKADTANGTAGPSMAASLLRSLPESGPERAAQEALARNVTTVAYAGGADTAVSTMQSTFLALCVFPEVLKKAQAELDAVVGPNRLPTFDDFDSLPYIQAMIKESNRWLPAIPSSFAHVSTAEEEYMGYRIPKGCAVACNTWSVLHNPQDYPDPERYNPDRWLKDGKVNPAIRDPNAAFGFGRRQCAGRHFSDTSFFILLACLLHVFDIKPALGEKGHPVHYSCKMEDGKISHPLPFPCTIKPRSEQAEELIKDTSLEF